MSLTLNNDAEESERIQGGTVYESVIQHIKTSVRNNDYKPGSRLPSERALAERLGISRPALREAMRTLSTMGVMEARQGSGTHLAVSSANVLRTSFEFLMLLDRPTVYELYETRELIEVHLAGRAAERRDEEDLVVMKDALEEMKQGVVTPPLMTDPNVRFHQAIATAAHHPVLKHFMDCLHDGILMCIEATRPPVFDPIGSYNRHVAIYDAILRQNPADARRAMTLHMAAAVETLRQREGESNP